MLSPRSRRAARRCLSLGRPLESLGSHGHGARGVRRPPAAAPRRHPTPPSPPARGVRRRLLEEDLQETERVVRGLEDLLYSVLQELPQLRRAKLEGERLRRALKEQDEEVVVVD